MSNTYNPQKSDSKSKTTNWKKLCSKDSKEIEKINENSFRVRVKEGLNKISKKALKLYYRMLLNLYLILPLMGVGIALAIAFNRYQQFTRPFLHED